jgi:precorrin-3B methylase
MLTVVLVGASTTRAFTGGDGSRRVYTPRGYGPTVSDGGMGAVRS